MLYLVLDSAKYIIMKTLRKKIRCIIISVLISCFCSNSLFGQIRADRQRYDTRYSQQVDNHSEQYLFAPSAIPLKKGSVRYKNLGISVNSLSVGISDQISLDVGVELLASAIMIANDIGGLLSYANLKIRHSIYDNLHVGVGLFVGGMLAVSDANHTGILVPYTLTTLGNRNYNLTLGLGLLPNNKAKPALIMLSGATKITPGLSLISENYLTFEKYEASSFAGEGSNGNMVFTLVLRHYGSLGHIDLGIGHSYSFWSNIELGGPQANRVEKGGNWFPSLLPVLGLVLDIP